MNTTSDRRAPGTTRIPFEAMVEVGGALGPSFEAQAVNVSGEGMSLRTAYLPEVGQPVTCRFDPGHGEAIVATGEVLWNEDLGDGGEFGIRFTKLDPKGASALQRVLGVTGGGAISPKAPGRKVRLHIDGLASPMRARVQTSDAPDRVTALSELGFLELGRPLELEDAASGQRRPASIDRVDVELHEESRVPQLVVTLRFEDEAATAAVREQVAAKEPNAKRQESLAPVVTTAAAELDAAEDAMDSEQEEGEFEEEEFDDEDDLDGDGEAMSAHEGHGDDPIRGSVRVRFDSSPDAADDAESDEAASDEDDVVNFKGKVSEAAAKIAPTMEQWAKRAKATVGVLAARATAARAKRVENVPQGTRRTTAPAPAGGLRTAGRKVVRVDATPAKKKVEELSPTPALTQLLSKKNVVIGASVALCVGIATLAFRSPDPPVAAVAPAPAVAASAVPEAQLATAEPAAAPAPMPEEPAAPRRVATNVAPRMPVDDTVYEPVRKKVQATPFGSGAVGRGNVLRLKMDGDIEQIHGASQPTGFTVVLPKRKSLEPAAPLASRDSRIAQMRVANESGGAELSVSFKDGVPNYQVRAKGDTLEIVLAQPGRAGERAPEAHVTTKKTRHKKRR